MLWAPNSGFGNDQDALLGGYTKYWPGGEWVDMIGEFFPPLFRFWLLRVSDRVVKKQVYHFIIMEVGCVVM